MIAYLCITCGTEFPPTSAPPADCPICKDERQYVGHQGQQWTTLAELAAKHQNKIFDEHGIWGVVTEPKFAIGQRALLVPGESGNILWDCVSLIDDATIERVKELGGIAAIAISHPHYYSSMIEWSRAFGNAPIYLHENDRQWVRYPDACIRYWSGETYALDDTTTLIRMGGHFSGYQVLHSTRGKGSLFSGDLPQVCWDKRFVSFMYSYPNYLPLNAGSVRRIVSALNPFQFETLYGAWPGFVIPRDAKRVIQRSAERYIHALATDR